MKLSREFKIGVVFVTTLSLFIWSYNYMKGKDIFKHSIPEFHTYLPQVQGLTTSSRVTMKGVIIGKVEQMKLIQEEGSLKVDVLFTLEDEHLKIPANSVVKLMSDGLMGGKSLAIIPGDGEPAKQGAYLRGEVENDLFTTVGAQLDPIQREVTKTLVSTDSLVTGLNEVLDPRTKAHLRDGIARLDRTLADFEQITASLKNTLQKNNDNINATFSGAKQAVDNINNMTARLQKELETAELSATVVELKNTLGRINTLLAGMEQGEGSMGKLLKDETLYKNLSRASKELEELLRDMKEHPKRYVHFSVFGKKDKGYNKEDKQ